MPEDITCIGDLNLMDKVYIRLGKSDTDLMYLYNAINGGLGKVCKTALLDFFEYISPDGTPVKFELPGFTNKKTKNTTVFRITFNEHEKKAVKKFLNMTDKGTFLKALLRMYAGKRLINLCKQKMLGKETKESAQEPIEETIQETIPEIFPVQDTKPVKPVEKPQKPIFKPEEF